MKLWGKCLFLSIPVILYVSRVMQPSQVFADWPTVGANTSRTSWTTEQVKLAQRQNEQVVWYRPIEAYIPENVQIIAANNLLYIATARGLYALNAATGAIAWRYDTEMPLGNSPTIFTRFVGKSVAYFAGFDRKVH